MSTDKTFPNGRRVEGALHLAGGAVLSILFLGLLPLLWIANASGESYLAVGILVAVGLGWTASGLAAVARSNAALWIARCFAVLVVGLFVWAGMT